VKWYGDWKSTARVRDWNTETVSDCHNSQISEFSHKNKTIHAELGVCVAVTRVRSAESPKMHSRRARSERAKLRDTSTLVARPHLLCRQLVTAEENGSNKFRNPDTNKTPDVRATPCSAVNSHLTYSFIAITPWTQYTTTFHRFYIGTSAHRDTSLFTFNCLKPHPSNHLTTVAIHHINIAHSANHPNMQWSVATGSDDWQPSHTARALHLTPYLRKDAARNLGYYDKLPYGSHHVGRVKSCVYDGICQLQMTVKCVQNFDGKTPWGNSLLIRVRKW
jgi:hypothetical protein